MTRATARHRDGTRVAKSGADRLGRIALTANARCVATSAVLVATFSFALCPTPAHAQEGPYSNYFVGDRSLGLAGAFVAVADDSSAVFHNPGGIAALTSSTASGSVWALLRGNAVVVRGYRTDLGQVDLEESAPVSVPVFLSGVVKFGARQRDGVRPHALGAALITPYAREDRFVEQIEGDAGTVDRLEVRHQDRARWFGLSYGLRVRPGLSFGASGFFSTRSIEHDEIEIRARDGADMNIGSSYERATTLSVEAEHMLFRLGTLLDVTPELRAGVMWQLPVLTLGQRADAESLRVRTGPTPTASSIEHADHLAATVPMPWELRFGVTVRKPPETLLSADLSVLGPVGSPSDPRPLVAPSNVELGAFVPSSTYRRTALRGAVGFETVIANAVPMRGGMFFERSATPPVLARSDHYVQDHIDTAGVALSGGLRMGGYDVSLGATAVIGWGEALALRRDDDFDAPADYEATNARTATFMIFVGGAKSAVKQLVETLIAD